MVLNNRLHGFLIYASNRQLLFIGDKVFEKMHVNFEDWIQKLVLFISSLKLSSKYVFDCWSQPTVKDGIV